MFVLIRLVTATIACAATAGVAVADTICQTPVMWCQLPGIAPMGTRCWCGNAGNRGQVIVSNLGATPPYPTNNAPRPPSLPRNPVPEPGEAAGNDPTTQARPRSRAPSAGGGSGCVEGLGDCGAITATGAGTYDSANAARAPVGDESCGDLSRAIAASPNEFASIKGRRDADGDWASEVIIPGFQECYIQHGQIDVEINLYCTGDQDLASALADLKPCLANWRFRKRTDSHGREHAGFSRPNSATRIDVWETTNHLSLSVYDEAN